MCLSLVHYLGLLNISGGRGWGCSEKHWFQNSSRNQQRFDATSVLPVLSSPSSSRVTASTQLHDSLQFSLQYPSSSSIWEFTFLPLLVQCSPTTPMSLQLLQSRGHMWQLCLFTNTQQYCINTWENMEEVFTLAAFHKRDL